MNGLKLQWASHIARRIDKRSARMVPKKMQKGKRKTAKKYIKENRKTYGVRWIRVSQTRAKWKPVEDMKA